MVQTPIRFKKGIAIELRKKGFSYSEIQNSINIPKSTIVYWIKDVPLTETQIENLKTRRLKTAKLNSEKRIHKTLRKIEEVKNKSAQEIGKISKRELWLMGVVLYWKERFLLKNDSDLKRGIRFTSSDPELIKFFLKWLKDVGKIENEEIVFDIFLEKEKEDLLDRIVDQWSKITGFSRKNFLRVYYLKKNKKLIKNKEKRKSKKPEPGMTSVSGMLRVRVKSSSMLARQIAGWVRGIEKEFFGQS